jgi:hypothetical protein
MRSAQPVASVAESAPDAAIRTISHIERFLPHPFLENRRLYRIAGNSRTASSPEPGSFE